MFYNLCSLLFITVIIAIITLIERKILALIQRRVGPNFIGFKGRLQYFADALKLFFKENIYLYNINNFFYILFPSLISIFSYIIWLNITWHKGLNILNIEFNIIIIIIFSYFYNFCIILTSYFSKNKYAFISCVRNIQLLICLETIFSSFIICYIFIFKNFNFSTIIIFQKNYKFFSFFFFWISFFLVIFLLETNRSPFDFIEAESELIAGYTNEYGNFLFALYYLGEYFHLFIFSSIFSIIFFGGWEENYFFYYYYSFKNDI